MITFYTSNKPLKSSENLVGKYILFDGHSQWRSYRGACLVREILTSKTVEVEEAKRRYDNEQNMWLCVDKTSEHDIADGGDIDTKRVGNIRCVCDTIEDVNTVFLMGKAVGEKLKALEREIDADYGALET